MAVESVAIKSRHDPQIVGAKMKASRRRGGGGQGGGGGTVRARNGAVYKLEYELYWFAQFKGAFH